MKRKNCEFCGADYELSDAECPYCGAANVDMETKKIVFSDELRAPKDMRCPYCNELDKVYKFDSFEKIELTPLEKPIPKEVPKIADAYLTVIMGGLILLVWIINGARSGGWFWISLSLFLIGYGARKSLNYNKFDPAKEKAEFQKSMEEYEFQMDLRARVKEKMHHLYQCARDEHIFFPGTPDSATYRSLIDYMSKYIDYDIN